MAQCWIGSYRELPDHAAPAWKESTPARRGAVIAFRDNAFADPPALIKMIAGEGTLAKVRLDRRVVISDWEAPGDRLRGVAGIVGKEAASRCGPSIPSW